MELAALPRGSPDFLPSADSDFHDSTSGSRGMIVCTYDHPGVPSEQSGPNRAHPGEGLASPKCTTGLPTVYYAQGNHIICIPSLKKKQVLISPNGTVLDATGILERKKASRLKPDSKKPPNSFMLFMRENRSRVAAEMKVNNGSVVCKALGEMWWSLTAQQKDEYYQRALLERRLHEQQHLRPSGEHIVKKKRKRKQEDSRTDSEKARKVRVQTGAPGREASPSSRTTHKKTFGPRSPNLKPAPKAQEQDCQPPLDLSCLDSVEIDCDPASITAELPDLCKLYGSEFMVEFGS